MTAGSTAARPRSRGDRPGARPRTFIIAFAGLLLALATMPVLAGRAAEEPAGMRHLLLSDWLDWERASDARISPDGRTIVYTRLSIDKFSDRWRRGLWIMNAQGGDHRFLAHGGAARWSPSGDRIAYIGGDEEGKLGSEIFVRRMDAEGALTQITHGADHPTDLSWSPDGRWIAYRARVPLPAPKHLALPGRPKGAEWTGEPDIIERLHYRVDRIGRVTWRMHLFLVPADGGTPRDLTPGEVDVGARAVGAIDIGSAPQWTPDGRFLVFDGTVPEKEGEEPDPFRSDIFVLEIATGRIVRLTRERGFWHHPRISPDGRRIAYVGNAAGDANYLPQQLRVIGIDGTGERALAEGLADQAQDLFWDGAGRGLYFTMNHEGRTDVFHIGLDGRMKRLTKGMHRLRLDSFSPDKGIAAGTWTSPHVSRNLVRLSLTPGRAKVRQLTDLNADILAGVALGRVAEFWADSSDGARIQGWVVYPPDFDPKQRHPMLLSIHGGPWSMYGVDFRFPFQAWAARGYVVVYANPRGSTGYGPDFAMAINGRYPGRRDFDDLMAAVDKAIAMGGIDPERLFVTGCSGGGVLTSWVVSHTDRFRAAAALCPVEEWISFAGRTDIAAWAHRMFPKPFWEDPTPWIEHSPLRHVGRVKTPTLLMTGELDLRTPLGEAESFYSALKMRGIPTRLIVMRKEWHGTTSKPSNMLRTILYLDDWFARFDPARATKDAGGDGGGGADR